jgi:PAS domain S-box-containing protein
MRIDLTLAQKGLILVSIPLVFELIFVLTLAWMLHQADSELERSLRSKEIIQTTNDIAAHIVEATDSARSFDFRNDDSLQNTRFDDDIRAIRRDVVKLKELVRGNGEEEQTVERIDLATAQAVQLLIEARQIAQEHGIMEAQRIFKKAKAKYNPTLERMVRDIRKLVSEEKAIEEAMPKVQRETRAQLQTVLAVGVAFNILLAVSLAAYFNRGTAGRLRVLMDNTTRLAKSQPLNPPLSGNDEIAHLDRVFNDMANALAAAARKERAIVENAIDVICSFDSNGNFIAISPASRRLLGYEPYELVGRNHMEFVVEDDQRHTELALKQIMESNTAGSYENRMRKKDGSIVDVLWSTQWSPVEDLVFSVAHNITDRKEIERMKQEFVAMVSHDLRTPLTSIQGFLTLLGTGMYGELSPGGLDNLTMADSNVRRLIALINDLLDIEKMESGKLKMDIMDINMGEVFERSTHAVAGFSQQQGVILCVVPTTARLYADPDRLVQVVVNLVSNAVKFSPQGQTVIVSAVESPDFVEVRVADKGRGIPAKFIDSIFERFQQVESSDAKKKGGSGLGLAICKAIVEGHHGSIGVESEEGKGSTFWFRIPRLPQDRMDKEPSVAAQSG